MKTRTLCLAAAAAALLAACGGGGGPEDRQIEGVGVPASATRDADSFSAYLVNVAEEDRAEPVLVDQLVPPTSETDEPLALR